MFLCLGQAPNPDPEPVKRFLRAPVMLLGHISSTGGGEGQAVLGGILLDVRGIIFVTCEMQNVLSIKGLRNFWRIYEFLTVLLLDSMIKY